MYLGHMSPHSIREAVSWPAGGSANLWPLHVFRVFMKSPTFESAKWNEMRWRGGEVLYREERTTKNGLEFRYDEVARWRNEVKWNRWRNEMKWGGEVVRCYIGKKERWKTGLNLGTMRWRVGEMRWNEVGGEMKWNEVARWWGVI